jgi:flavorubredoxin
MHTPLRENIDWVGCLDWNVRDFHSYDTPRGATYNAYLVRDEKTALIDAVKEPFAAELLRNVSELCDPGEVRYVVCNHAEPDHSGALAEVLRAMPEAVLVCDRKCRVALGQHYDTSAWQFQIVATGDAISLGRRTLRFIETPMVHWPESMFTYVPEEKVLFSMDAFGQHFATNERLDDEVELAGLMAEAKTYYANIVMPYGKQVVKCLDSIADLPIEMLATSHGVIWRSHVGEILEAYREWSVCRPRPKVLVVYDTMWESTTAMARAIVEGAAAPGVDVQLLHARRASLTRIATEALDAAAIALGSSTLNREMMPALSAVLCYLKGLRPTGKVAFAFGSYGWGRGGPEAIGQWIGEMGWEVLREPLKAQYRPTPEILDECRAAGRMLAEKAVELSQSFATGIAGSQ